MIRVDTDTFIAETTDQLLSRASAVKLSRRDIGDLVGVSAQAVQLWSSRRYTDNAHTLLRMMTLNNLLSVLSEEECGKMRDSLKYRKAWVTQQAAV